MGGATCCYFRRKRSCARVLPSSVTNGLVASCAFITAMRSDVEVGQGAVVGVVRCCPLSFRWERRGQDVTCAVNCAVFFCLYRPTIEVAVMKTLLFFSKSAPMGFLTIRVGCEHPLNLKAALRLKIATARLFQSMTFAACIRR